MPGYDGEAAEAGADRRGDCNCIIPCLLSLGAVVRKPRAVMFWTVCLQLRL